jgi:diguanylate cyclase (GGDEF)-like protein/PAS domain S-box-containing protein
MKNRVLVVTIIVTCLLCVKSALGDEIPKHLRFGVLSFRPKEITTAQWLPLAKELEHNLPNYSVELVPLTYPELNQAAKENTLDFVLTNPEHYVLLKNKMGINAAATMITLEKGHPLTYFAGVIFTRADRMDIQTFSDLNDKKIASPSEESLGGYLMQRWELEKNNVIPKSYLFTGMPHDKVVDEVLGGNADAGFVRSGVLEKLAQTGKITLGENPTIRVIEPHPITDGIPVLHSTDHYPEWAFCLTKDMNSDISRRITLALLNIKSDSDVAKTAGIAGFNAPADYTPVEILMLRLRAHPDQLKYFNFSDVIWRYRNNVVIALVVTFAIFVLILFLILTNRKLAKTEKQLQESNAEISLLLNSMAEGAYGVDTGGFCRFVNASFLQILGYDNADAVLGKHIHELVHHSHADGTPYPSIECKMYNAYRQHKAIHVTDEVFWRKDGTAIPVEYWSQPIIANGVVTGAIATFVDVTERREIEKELHESRTRLQTIIETSPECIQIVDQDGKLIDINSAGLAMLEIDSREKIAVRSIINFIVPEYRDNFKQLHQRVIAGEALQMEFEIVGFKGTRRWLETHSVPMPDNGKTVRLSVTRDITERKQAEQKIKQLAYYDSLTHLPNRSKLLERLTYSIQLSHREGKKFSVFMMDLDKFKRVNDTLGHAAGDDLLKQVAFRISKRLRDSDMVARLGGDEFVIVLGNCSESEDAGKIAADVIKDLTQPFELSDKNVVQIGASIGISFYPQHGVTPEKLIDNADVALYQAKNNGRGNFVYCQ